MIRFFEKVIGIQVFTSWMTWMTCRHGFDTHVISTFQGWNLSSEGNICVAKDDTIAIIINVFVDISIVQEQFMISIAVSDS